MGTAGRTGPSWESRTIQTDERMDERRTDERALRRDQIKNGRWSIETCQHPLSAEQSRSGHLLQLPHSLFVSSFRFFFATFSIYLALPTSISPLSTTSLPRLFALSCSYSFSPTSLLAAFFSPHLRRILFSSLFSHCDPPSPLRHPNIPFYRPSFRCRTGTRNSSSLPTHGFDYSQLRQQPILRIYLYNLVTTTTNICVGICMQDSFVPVSFGPYEL